MGWNGSVGTATHYGLGVRLNLVGARFFAPIQTGPGPPSHLYNGSLVFPGVKRLGRAVDHPLPSSADVNEIIQLYLYSLLGPSWPVLG